MQDKFAGKSREKVAYRDNQMLFQPEVGPASTCG